MPSPAPAPPPPPCASGKSPLACVPFVSSRTVRTCPPLAARSGKQPTDRPSERLGLSLRDLPTDPPRPCGRCCDGSPIPRFSLFAAGQVAARRPDRRVVRRGGVRRLPDLRRSAQGAPAPCWLCLCPCLELAGVAAGLLCQPYRVFLRVVPSSSVLCLAACPVSLLLPPCSFAPRC